MHNQLRVEFYKLTRMPLLYIAMFLMFMLGYFYGYLKFDTVLNTSEAFSEVICDTSLLFFISIVAAWLIGTDFGTRTITHELKLGYSRQSVILSRLTVVTVLSVLLHLTYVVSSIAGFVVAHGFDTSVFVKENAVWMLTVMLQLAAIESGTVMICFMARKPLGAVSLSVIYTFVSCNVLRNFLDDGLFVHSCFCFARKCDAPWLLSCAVSALVYFVIFVVLAVAAFRRADLT